MVEEQSGFRPVGHGEHHRGGGGEGGRTEAAESGSGHRSAAVPIFGISHNIKIEVAWVYFSRLKAFIFDAFHSTRLVVPAHSLKATLH